MQFEIKHLGRVEYLGCYEAMRSHSLARSPGSADELWCLEHPPVYTLGLNAGRQHLLDPGDIPVIHTDRGGQVTYHGPGQLLVYCLLDMGRRHYGIKDLVRRLEQGVMDYLASLDIVAARRAGAPGVYVNGKKIAALGIRVKRGYTWHGLALNVNMDLSPFKGINPCGYAGLEITQMSDLGIELAVDEVAAQLLPYLVESLADARAPDSGEARPGLSACLQAHG